MINNPIYTIFAGINGAGKSTFYSFLDKNEKEELGIRINPDEIAVSLGNFNDNKIQMLAGKEAIRLISTCIKDKVNFNQETTLSSRASFRNIKKAKENGFRVHLIYIYLNNVNISKERVERRVIEGGHLIPNDVIERRYIKSLENLKILAKELDSFTFFDNSHIGHKLMYLKVNGIEIFKEEGFLELC